MSGAAGRSLWGGYAPLDGTWDEFFGADGAARPASAEIVSFLERLGRETFQQRQALADATFLQGGVTFSVYSDARGAEKIFPFDLIPRVITASEWSALEAGLTQRVEALNLFLADLYGPQRVLRDKVVPEGLIFSSAGWRPQLMGVQPRGGTYVHVAGIDLVRDPSGAFLVLEDNLRTPSGVSYVLENRNVMQQVLPGLFERARLRPVMDYPVQLRHALTSLSPRDPEVTRIVVLTPGPFNSAYFEHGFLARGMGVGLVQPQDLFVDRGRVWVKTTHGPQQVDVIYRRVDDDFLDPTVFRADSLLGVPGLVDVYARGHVTLANALGNGVADDKAIYPFVPALIRYYLDEEPKLGQVPTFLCERPAELAHVLGRLDEMVVKAVDASGGYGMLMGPQASRAEREAFAAQLKANPRGYIAQPLISLSASPTWCGGDVAPRRVDLRPFVVRGRETWVLPGGLSRVALVEGSYVVNSSQGGGSKDTWVLQGEG